MVITMRKKRLFAVLALGAFLLSGCQAAPEEQSVVSKNDGSFKSALTSTQAAEETMPSHVQLAENFASTDGSVQFHMNIDQTLITGNMPVVEVVPSSITSEDMQRVAKALLGDVEFYEREPSSNPQYSKSQYQEMITRLAPYSTLDAVTELVGIGKAEDTLESVKATIAWITEAMETAPEENPHVRCDWALKKERFYNDSEWDISGRPLAEDNDWLVATAQKKGIGYKYMVVVRDQDDYKLNRFSLQLGGASVDTYTDRLIYWSKLCRTEEPTKQQIQDVHSRVIELLEKIDLGDWQIADTQVELYGTTADPEYMLRIYAVPMFNNIPAVFGQKNITKSDDYTGAYVLTEANFLMSANGDLIEMQLDSPIEIKSVINENVATLPFSQLVERAQQHLSLSDAEAFGLSVAILEEQFEEKVICHVDITHMKYGLGRVMIENTTDRYYYVPVLMLRGNVEYRGENTGTVYYSNTYHGLDNLLCINAVDGSIIG